MYVCYVLFNKYSILNKYVINIPIYNHSNTLRERVASNSGERWDQVHLVPSNFRDWLSGGNMGRRRKRKGNRHPHHCGAVHSNVEAEVAPMLPLAEAIWIFVNWTSDWSRLFRRRETGNWTMIRPNKVGGGGWPDHWNLVAYNFSRVAR